MTEDAAAAGINESDKGDDTSDLPSQRVFKKSSPNNKLTLYLSSRELISKDGTMQPLRGVLLAEPDFVEDKKVYGQITLTFRYGREDEEVMGLRFCNEAVMCLAQLWPPKQAPTENPNSLQEALVKRLGNGAVPFTLHIPSQAPPSVQLVPAKRYHGAPIGTSYDVRAYVAEKSDEKMHRRSTVRMGIRVTHRNLQNWPTSPSLSPVQPKSTKSEFKLKLSPKNFRISTKIGKNREIEKRDSITETMGCPTGAPRGAVDKPFLLREGRVGLRASLDRGAYAHGDKVLVTVVIKNDSRKTVRRIKVFAVQHVDVCMFSNGKFKNTVANATVGAECPVPPGGVLNHTYTLTPARAPTKNWIALEDTFSRSPESLDMGGLASSVTRSSQTPEERNVFAIYVSYYVKVKLTLSGMGGELCLKLPFSLGHVEEEITDEKKAIADANEIEDAPIEDIAIAGSSKKEDIKSDYLEDIEVATCSKNISSNLMDFRNETDDNSIETKVEVQVHEVKNTKIHSEHFEPEAGPSGLNLNSKKINCNNISDKTGTQNDNTDIIEMENDNQFHKLERDINKLELKCHIEEIQIDTRGSETKEFKHNSTNVLINNSESNLHVHPHT